MLNEIIRWKEGFAYDFFIQRNPKVPQTTTDVGFLKNILFS